MVRELGDRDVSEQSVSLLPVFHREQATRREWFSIDTVVAMTMGISHSFLVTDTLAKDTHGVERWDH